MKRSTSRAVPSVALVLACLCLPTRVTAQAAIEHASEDQQRAARAAYGEGVQAFERGEHALALERFEAADSAVSSPNVKLMRARCLVKLGRDVDAYAMYGATVAEAKASGEARYQASSDAAVEERRALEAKLAVLTLNVKDDAGSAVLAINGDPLPRERWGEPLSLAPGPLDIALTAPDGQEVRAQRTLAAGARETLELKLAPRSAAPEPAPVADVPREAQEPVPPAKTTQGGTPVLPIVLAAAGGVGLAAFAVFGAMSNGELATLESRCPTQRDCDPELAEVADRGRTYQTVANVALGAGVVLLAAGVTLFVLELPSDDMEVAVTSHGAVLRGAL